MEQMLTSYLSVTTGHEVVMLTVEESLVAVERAAFSRNHHTTEEVMLTMDLDPCH